MMMMMMKSRNKKKFQKKHSLCNTHKEKRGRERKLVKNRCVKFTLGMNSLKFEAKEKVVDVLFHCSQA